MRPEDVGRRLSAARAAHGTGRGYALAFDDVAAELAALADDQRSLYAAASRQATAALQGALVRLREEVAALRRGGAS